MEKAIPQSIKSKSAIQGTVWLYLLAAFLSLNLAGCEALHNAWVAAQSAPKYIPNDSPPPPVNCPDVELIGLASSYTAPLDLTIWTAQIRNKASYTKNITVAWVDMYGQTQSAAFNIQAGQMIYGNIAKTTGNQRAPQDLHITACY
jgi:hypothetical protein